MSVEELGCMNYGDVTDVFNIADEWVFSMCTMRICLVSPSHSCRYLI